MESSYQNFLGGASIFLYLRRFFPESLGKLSHGTLDIYYENLFHIIFFRQVSLHLDSGQTGLSSVQRTGKTPDGQSRPEFHFSFCTNFYP